MPVQERSLAGATPVGEHRAGKAAEEGCKNDRRQREGHLENVTFAPPICQDYF
jgi:hypothetical protein